MNAFRKYWAIASISAKSNLVYVTEAGSRLVFLAVVLYTFMQLWSVTYKHTGMKVLGGLSLNEMLWYLALTESIIMSSPRITVLVDEDVRTGALAVQLVRPMSYPLYRLFATLGERVVRFLITFVAASLIAFLIVGPLPSLRAESLLFLLALPLAFALDFFGYFFVGLGAFWMEDTTGPMLIFSRLTMILGGMLIPLQLFPDYMQPALAVLPFSSMVYGPARLFVSPDVGEFVRVVSLQAAWLVVFAGAVFALYGVALKRINANGG